MNIDSISFWQYNWLYILNIYRISDTEKGTNEVSIVSSCFYLVIFLNLLFEFIRHTDNLKHWNGKIIVSMHIWNKNVLDKNSDDWKYNQQCQHEPVYLYHKMSKTQYCDDRASMAGFRDGLNLYDTSNISYNEKQSKNTTQC